MGDMQWAYRPGAWAFSFFLLAGNPPPENLQTLLAELSNFQDLPTDV